MPSADFVFDPATEPRECPLCVNPLLIQRCADGTSGMRAHFAWVHPDHPASPSKPVR